MITDLIPYLVASGTAAAGSTTLVLNVGSGGGYPVLPGDTIIVAGGGGATTQPTGITDSQGNTYTAVVSLSSPNDAYFYVATAGAHGLRSDLPDTVTITYSGTTAPKTAMVYACAGLLASPVDTAVTASAGGTSASPAVTAAGNPAAAGELVLALVAANQPAPPTWSPHWLQLGTQLNNTGLNGWSLACYTPAVPAAMPPYGPPYAPAASATLGSSVTWAALMIALKPAAVAQGGMVGLSCWTGTYGGSTRITNSQNADAVTGRKMAMQVQRTYFSEGQWPASINSPQELGHLSDAGVFQVVSFHPQRAPGGGVVSERTNLKNALILFKNYIAQKGSGNARFACAYWQECNGHSYNGPFGNGSQSGGPSPYGNVTTDAAAAQNFRDYCNYYGPTITAAGIPVAYMPAIYSPAAALTFFPGRALCNAWCLDYYCRGDFTGNGYTLTSPSDTLSQAAGTLAGYTFSPPLPYGIGEWGYADGANLPTNTQFHNWVTGQLIAPLQNFMTNGGNLAWLTWFTAGTVNTIQSGSPTITDIQAFYDALQAAPGGALAVTTTGLPGGVIGTAYSATLTASGGTAPYTWAVTVGTLPAGLSLASSTGVISGTPTTAATSSFTVQVTDSLAATATAALSITVTATNTTFPSITTTTLPAATIGSAYSQALAETGGTSPFTWAVTSGNLPDGLALDPAAGLIAGTPSSAAATSGFTVTITDAAALTGSQALFITVVASSPAPSPAAAASGFPQVIVEAGFLPSAPQVPAGTFLLDDPVYGQLSEGNQLGDTTAWTNITSFVRSGTVSRTSTRVQGPLITYQPGTGSMVLKNGDGRFDPDNASSPYSGSLRAMVPFRVRAVYGGTEYHLFSGFTDSWTTPGTNWGPQYSETTVSATDGFKILAGVTIPPGTPDAQGNGAGDGEDTGARAARILTAAGWYTDHRRIDTGDSTVQGTLFGDTALNLLQLTADNEAGEAYIDGSGAVVFRHRHAALTDARSTVVQAIFGDAPGTVHGNLTELPYLAVERSADDAQLANDIQATTAGGKLQEAQSRASQRTYLFPRSYVRSDLILEDDPATKEWAQWVLAVSLASDDRFDQLTIAPLRDPADLFPQALGREAGDLIQVIRRPPGVAAITKNLFIRGITHTVDVSSNTWQTTWDLQNAAPYTGFLILDNTTTGLLNTGKLAF